MNFPRRVIFLFLIISTTFGCASINRLAYTASTSQKYLIQDNPAILKDKGIVLGQVTGNDWIGFLSDKNSSRGFQFINLDTKETTWFSGEIFMVALPEGEYEINKLATRTGDPYVPFSQGFKFRSVKGKILYIGTIVHDKDFERYIKNKGLTTSEASKVKHATHDFGTYVDYWGSPPTITHPHASFDVIDERKNVIEYFHTIFPALKDIVVEIEYMK